jgi:hypothetical protein
LNLTVKFNDTNLRAQLNEFVFKLKGDAVLLLKEESRLLLRDILKFSPPRAFQGPGKKFAGARQDVDYDLTLVAQPLDWKNIQEPRLAEAVQKKDLKLLAILGRRSRGLIAGRTFLSAADVKAVHYGARNGFGRVKSDQKRFMFLSDWRKYNRSVKGNIGLLQSGWSSAASALGQPLPNWVSRQTKKKGKYTPATKTNLTSEMSNPMNQFPKYYRILEFAVSNRVKSLQAELKAILEGRGSRRESLKGTSAAIAKV